MPLQIPDMTIASKVQNPDAFKTIGSMLNMQTNQLALQKARATFDADVSQRQSESSSAGSAATVNAANVQPLIQQQAAQTSTAQTASQAAQFKLTGEQTGVVNQVAQGLISDPDVAAGNIDKIIPLLNSAQQRMVDMGVPAMTADVQVAHLKTAAASNPGGFAQLLKNGILQSQQPSQQSTTIQPTTTAVGTGGTTNVYNPNPFSAAGGSQTSPVAVIPNTLAPGAQESVITDSQGRIAKVTRSPQGAITGAAPVAGVGNGSAPAPLQNVPNNESQSSMDALNSQYQDAQGQALKAPNMHSLNQEIYRLSDTDVGTGKLGSMIRSASNLTGYHMASGDAENYNTLGKMLAQNNAQLAASMGPHTNAGLAQTNEANGTLEYDKNTLKTIATRNDALVTGTELYAQGLKHAIDTNGLPGKHQFDAKWGAAFDVDAMALKNSVDNGNKGQTQMIIKKLGGPNSDGAKALFKKLTAIDALAGQ